MLKTNRITVWDHPDHIFLSGYGVIKYSSWCEKEISRAAIRGIIWKIIKNKKGEISLARVGV